VDEVLAGHWTHGGKPELWDGQTAARIVADIRRRMLIVSERAVEEGGVVEFSAHQVLGNA
jgi:UDP-N-acetylglucosamine 2-epimerase (non-hydrolysing)